MKREPSAEITDLIVLWRAGDQDARDRLAEKVHGELHRMAAQYMRNEHPGHTLQATALVNEVYLRMVGIKNVDWESKAQFFAVCAQMMKRILVNSAHARNAAKRGGGAVKLNMDETAVMAPERDESLLALDDALEVFKRKAPRQAQVVELRYFGGLSTEQIAFVLQTSERTVLRDWDFARAWLMQQLSS